MNFYKHLVLYTSYLEFYLFLFICSSLIPYILIVASLNLLLSASPQPHLSRRPSGPTFPFRKTDFPEVSTEHSITRWNKVGTNPHIIFIYIILFNDILTKIFGNIYLLNFKVLNVVSMRPLLFNIYSLPSSKCSTLQIYLFLRKNSALCI